MKYQRGGTDHAVAVGRVRVKEKFLFNKDYLFSLADAPNAETVMDMLAKTNYGRYFNKPSYQMDYRDVIDGKWRSVRRLYAQIIADADNDILSFLWCGYDLHNAKVLLKSMYLNTEPEGLMSIGTVDIEKMKALILKNERPVLPAWIAEGISAAKKEFGSTKDPREIDIVLDGAYFGFLRRIVGTSGNKFLRDLLVTEIDLYNIKTFLRMKARSGEQKYLSRVLVEGGSRSKSFYAGIFAASGEEIINSFKGTSYDGLVKAGLAAHAESGSFWKIEKLIDDHTLIFVRQAKHNAFGYEPLISYVFARRSEARALRSIMEGKLADMSPAFIRERIPEVYV